jgi:hypothetical protein
LKKRKRDLQRAEKAYEVRKTMDNYIAVTAIKGDVASRERLLHYQRESLETILGERRGRGDQ